MEVVVMHAFSQSKLRNGLGVGVTGKERPQSSSTVKEAPTSKSVGRSGDLSGRQSDELGSDDAPRKLGPDSRCSASSPLGSGRAEDDRIRIINDVIVQRERA